MESKLTSCNNPSSGLPKTLKCHESDQNLSKCKLVCISPMYSCSFPPQEKESQTCCNIRMTLFGVPSETRMTPRSYCARGISLNFIRRFLHISPEFFSIAYGIEPIYSRHFIFAIRYDIIRIIFLEKFYQVFFL